MASLVYVGCGLVKVEVIVECDAKVFKTVNDLDRLMVDGFGVLG